MSSSRLLVALLLGTFLASSAPAADWNQWRGPDRSGAADSPELRTSLPESGLKPVWMTTAHLKSNTGWSSPVVADGRLYLYSHDRERREGVNLEPPKYPKLSDEELARMPEKQRDAYEENRRNESVERQRKQNRVFDRITCLDATSGDVLWTADEDSEPTRWRQSSTPAVDSGRLYYLSADRKLRCIDTEGGATLWSTPLPIEVDDNSPVSSSPVVAEGMVFVCAEQLIAFTTDGKVAWTSEASQSGAVHSSPVIYEGGAKTLVIANIGKAGTVAFDAKTGTRTWSVDSGAGRSTPVVHNDLLLTYGSSRKGGLRCYRMSGAEAEPELLWKYHRMADQGSSPAVADGRVFVQGDRNIACLDLETGDVIWDAMLERNRPRYTSPIAGGGLFFYSFGGVIAIPTKAETYEPAFDARVGKEGLLAPESWFRAELGLAELERTAAGQEQAQKLWQQEVERPGPRDCVSPALVDGRLYLRLNGGVACYDLRAE